MAKFTRKTTTVEAVQWKGGLDHPGVEAEPCTSISKARAFRHYVTTIHGQKAYLNPGDWIMPEPDGVHFYPCKDEVFRATYEPAKPINSHDKHDMVRMVGMLQAGALKLAAYRVRDPDTDQFSTIQFHETYDNTVGAVMGEQQAMLFARFINDTLNPEKRKTHMDLVPMCRKFIDDNKLTGPASIVVEDASLHAFIQGMCECIGYAKEVTP